MISFINRKQFSITVMVIGGFCMSILSNAQPVTPPSPYPAGTQASFIRTWDATAPEADGNNLMNRSLKDVKQATQYFDGLGRPLQTVIKEASLETGGNLADMVNAVVYDEFGREQYKYLPSPANNTGGNTSISDGAFKLNPFQQEATFMQGQYGSQGETYFYSKTNFEASPLNRVDKTMALGNNWVGAPNGGRGVEVKYWLNTPTDAVRIWTATDTYASGTFGAYSTSATYTSGILFKSVTVDEHSKQVIEFKDKFGQVILKKVQLTATSDNGSGSDYTGWLSTYYIYDDFGLLRCVIQPKGVELLIANNWNINALNGDILNEQCFRYEYDQRNRMILKKFPGAAEVRMVYDKWDRLVMTQDGTLRNNYQWMYMRYDELNRPIASGIWTDYTNYNNFSYHLDQASSSTSYPVLNGQVYEELSNTFYDNYDWRNNQGNPLSNLYNSSHDNYFQTTSNTSWPYPQANVQSGQLKGMVTGTKTKILGVSTYLFTVNFYDEKGRVIQVESTNITGGTDINTTQYTWAGQPLVVIQQQQLLGGNAQTSVVVTQMTFDDLGRIAKTEKKLSNTLVNSNAMPAYKTIAQNEYDKLGQLKKKSVGTNSTASGPLETLSFDYNIRGWMLGMNRDYLIAQGQSGTNRFGFELGYDKLTSNSGRSYTDRQYNGNITGMVWKSDGDDVKRKYDFSYDAANRLMLGIFEQDDAISSWNAATMNYKVQMGNGANPATAYDANGNIKAMTQYGWKIGAPTTTPIDNLAYNYMPNSNKLLNVIDANNIPDTKLGDFRTSLLHPNQSKTPTTVDYTYDPNGNLKKDLNKDIGTASAEDIIYNYLNLPQSITVRKAAGAVKGTISYTYDAAGNKLSKATQELGVTVNLNGTNYVSDITTTTSYLGGFVYESKSYSNGALASLAYPDKLQFISHEEGRVRFKPTAGSIPASFQYDYMLKDHLGNVRVVLTEEQQTDMYPVATMETANATIEETYYSNLPATRENTPAEWCTGFCPQNDKVAKVNGGGNKIGPAITLKVMAGDKFNLRVNSWYKTYGASPGSPVSPLGDLLTALAGGVGNITSTHGGATVQEITNSGVLIPGATNFLYSQSYDISKPKAFINWIFLDEQFKYYAGGFEQVGNNETLITHLFNDVAINKSGYLYVYVSNETRNIDVFFDNLQVTHIRGPILEETHYYPFGLVQQGISSKALNFGQPENRKKFNGIEHTTEFDLNMYDAFYRGLDPQIGRWWEIDPKVDNFYEWSPYNLNYDNPIKFVDPLGDFPWPILRKLAKEGAEWAAKTLKGTIKPISREQAIKRLKNGESVYSTGENTAKNAKKIMKEAAGSKPVVRHDGHQLPNGKTGNNHYQKKSGDGSHVFYNSLIIIPGSVQIPSSGDNAAATTAKLVNTQLSISLNPAGALYDAVGKATGLNNAGKAVLGNNSVGRFVDNWLNPFN
jgi:RHS repeat-associated protein